MDPREDDVSQHSPSAGGSTSPWLDDAMAVEGAPLPSLQDLERRYITRVLQEARGNQRRAARILGISRWSLSRRLRKYGLPPRAAA
jgi:DNA-binding NtrC family response regulator